MRLAVDYTAAARQGGGIGRYARELVGALLATDDKNEYVLMAASAGLGTRWRDEQARLRTLAAAPERLGFRSLPLTDDWMARIWQRLRLPLPAELVTGPVDVFYSPDFVLPPLHTATRSLLTVHDLSFLRLPETFPPPLLRYLNDAVPRSVARADHILADSDATREDLIALLNVPPDRVTTLYSGVSHRFDPTAAPNERKHLQTHYGIGERLFVLTVGTVQPRKNYIRLMQACDPLVEEHNVELVIVGRPAWLADTTLEAADARPYVRRLGFVADGDLPALYRQAAVFAFPSLYEGFGLPPLEAMACGTPVVASTRSSVPEVVGDAGLLVDPLDVPGWTEALRRLLDDASLRATLRQRGLNRAARFTWKKAAQRWLKTVTRLTQIS
ncbi:MAG: glycosyltransferase family 4 protein [Anaerolineae bacterium]